MDTLKFFSLYLDTVNYFCISFWIPETYLSNLGAGVSTRIYFLRNIKNYEDINQVFR